MEKYLNMIKNTPDTTCEYDSKDIEQNRVLALISYVNLLCLVPLLMKKSSFASYHGRQGLVLAILEWIVIGLLTLFGGIPLIGFIFRIAAFLAKVAAVAYSVLGIYNALSGRAKELPFIGKYTLKF